MLSPAIIIDGIKREKQRRNAETDLIEFTKQAWAIIEPGVQFKDNWHLHAIAEHLSAVSDGEIENLVINIPPGCMKSILVSVAWPAWEWIGDPSLRYLGASYGADLSIRDAMKTRDIITSEWFQERWSNVQIKRGEDQKTKYALTGGGWRMATSVGGRATGEHPDRKIVDDPHNAKQAESQTEREGALTWFDRTLSTRGESRGARTVVVMQRLHERDMTGHIVKDLTGYEHLCLPMRYEKNTMVSVLDWKDPRSTEGQLLWPEMFDEKSITKLERILGEYGTAGQLQQHPSPAGGGILKTNHIKMWDFDRELPAFDFVIQSYDTAFTEIEKNDPSACTVWGLFDNGGTRCAMLLDAWADWLGYPALRQKVIDDWGARYGVNKTTARKGRRADMVLVEQKASGQSLLQDLNLANVPAVPYLPGSMDKTARAHMAAPVLEIDCIYMLESKKNRGEFISWAKPLMEQMEKFPNDEHDDLVDTFTQFVIYARDNSWFDLEGFPEDPIDEIDYHSIARQRVNPYAA